MKSRIAGYTFGGLVALLILGCTWFYLDQVRPLGLYRAKSRELSQRLAGLNKPVPAEVTPRAWERLTILTDIAFCNVFYHPSAASYDELLRFESEFQEKLRTDQPVRIETLRWIWKRLGQTGPLGKDYTERMMALFEESASQAKTL